MIEDGHRPDAGFERRPVHSQGGNGASAWGIAVETPVELRLNNAPWTVMLATPTDLEDFAVGLALTEGIVADHHAITQIDLTAALGEATLDLTIAPELLTNLQGQARSLAGNAGCGLCGLESLAALHARHADFSARSGDHQEISDEVIRTAFAALPPLQVINQATRSVHAAAWCSLSGQIEVVREDVGRHNALDKLVGALARTNHLGTPGFVIMTSRCSYELVSKAATARAHLLATISAPTTLALTWSATLGVPLACLGPGQHIVHFPQESFHAS